MSFNPHDMNYRYLLTKLLNRGNVKTDRTGTGTSSLFGEQLRFNLDIGFPLLTSKHVPWRLIVAELIWFLKGDTNIKFLHDKNCSIWDEWADKDGNLGPIYGRQWRSWAKYEGGGWDSIDQIAKVIETLKTNPDSRRMVVSAWNVADLEYMALEPCHCLFQFYVSNGKLSCHLYQRSADIFLGVPFNIASYAMLTHMIAQVTGLGVDQLIISFGDVHLYMNHIEQAEIQVLRGSYDPPRLWLNPDIKNIDDFTVNDVMMVDYNHYPPIKAPVAV